MRTFIFLCITSAFSFVPNELSSQNAKIKVDADKIISVAEMFELIQEQVGYKFVYNDELIANAPKIELEKGKILARKLLERALNPINCTYEFTENKTIVVQKGIETVSEIQQITVKGTITDASGMPLPGASILEKGTSNGAQSDFDGNFTLNVSSDDVVLVISYIGYATKEVAVAGQSNITIALAENAAALDEVVVTALGIKRSKRSLAYSITKVDGDDFTETRETNIANGLAGKVAGVNVTKTATGPAGTARVLIRGNSSLTGNNQPLYVVDGIPIDNANRGSAGEWGGSDGGDGIGNINPDDIETMSVLKGNSAAALYGSQASNGVILITTKRGKLNQGLQVEVNSNYVFEEAINHLDPQTEYGSGLLGQKPTTQAEAWDAGEFSWGTKLDGSSVIQSDGISRPYAYSGNNFDKFYRTGSTFTNTVSLSGGTADIGYRFSASNMENESIMPNSGMKRQTFSMNMHGKGMDDKLSFQASAQYILQDVRNRSQLADSPGNAHYSVWQLPVNVDVRNLKGDPERLGANPEDATDLYGDPQGREGYELLPTNSVWFQNPYWAAYQQTDKDSKDRVIASASIQYDINDWVYVKARAGIDQSDRIGQGINPTGTGYSRNGGMSQSQAKYQQTNFDIMVGSRHEFDNGIAYDFLAGANKMRLQEDGTSASGSDFALPFFYSISNGINNSGGSSFSKLGSNSVYGQAEISYNNWLFLTGSARNDWFSVLDGRDVFYPSVGLSAVLSDVLELPEAFDYVKVRTSWAQVGGVGDIGAYSLNQNYSQARAQLGVPRGGLSGSSVRNSNLNPLLVTELELGFNVQLLNNRLGVDFSYYDKKTEDDILNAGISYTSGYSSSIVNVGELTNKGVELLLTGTPIQTDNFRWNVSFNMSYNKSKVVSLVDPENDEERFNLGLSRARHAWVTHIEGKPFGQITGSQYLRDANGEIALDANGLPQVDEEAGTVAFGTGVHPFNAGLQNNFKYKDWSLGFLIDMRDGAVGHSGTNAQLYRRGVHKNTLIGRETGLGGNPASEIRNYYTKIFNDIAEEFIYDAGFIKLREISLSYNVPSKFLEKTFIRKASISAVGRNLWLIHSNVDNIDPESSYSATNVQGLDFFAMPQSSSFGFNVNLTF
ncbi:SusC/RagA family TonB-linked outer membrane protein [Snuella sedimenti]|uniref:SusC/RagA family TonB-linked outer membrane protein n=1 Tax=Snuella sedimenti TaxID=2798802 RepID=A0A8J7J579_9FLAO|nr:SusC/RagA family TonB-linked outer membrane protein [Snuella sedimenti]MBJ6368789.1 SusC/RagA family TonB-linked outer membrane protein [Snuella sedimenti]